MQEKERRSAKQALQDLKMEIRSSQNTLIIAVDIGKVRNCACFVSSSGKVLRRRFFFTNTIDGFRGVNETDQVLSKEEKLPHTLFGMEPSGYYWIHLYKHLIRCGKRAKLYLPWLSIAIERPSMYPRINQILRMLTILPTL